MPAFAPFRARRHARRAADAFQRGGWAAAAAVLDEARALGAGPWAHLAVYLYNAGHGEDAERAIRRALELEPERGDALIFRAELLAETDRPDDAIATYRRLLARFPGAVAQALALAKLLAEKEAFADAVAVLTPFANGPLDEARLALAQYHFELGHDQEALVLLDPIVRQLRLALRQGMLSGGAREGLIAHYEAATQLHDEVYAARHGRESVVEARVHVGQLDARAGVNYRLLGQARMMRPRRWTADPRLRTVEEGQAFGESLIASGERSRGLCHLALAQLRRGRFDEAHDLFDQARALDDDNFAAYLGLGAAMILARVPVLERIAELRVDPSAPPEGLEKVVVDWPALTLDERQVVMAMSAPLLRALPRIAAAGGVARLLPIDALLTDLPEMAEGGQERLADHRCLQAINGAANTRLCASKIEELFEGVGAEDSVFAHELAHLAHHHASDEVCARIDTLYERAVAAEYVITSYQSTNPAEFLAVAYTDYLAQLYELPHRRELDEEGIIEETFDLFRDWG